MYIIIISVISENLLTKSFREKLNEVLWSLSKKRRETGTQKNSEKLRKIKI